MQFIEIEITAKFSELTLIFEMFIICAVVIDKIKTKEFFSHKIKIDNEIFK